MRSHRFHDVVAVAHHALGLAYYLYPVLFGGGLGVAALALFAGPGRAMLVTGVAIGSALTVSGAAAWLTLQAKRQDYLNPGLDIVRQVDTYEVGPARTYVFTKEIQVRARSHGVDRFLNRFKWTGEGQLKATVSPTSAGTCSVTADGVWDGLVVDFGHALAVGERRSFTVTLTMSCEKKAPMPFFRKLIDDHYPSGLTMQVRWQHPPHSIHREVYASARSKNPLKRTSVKVKQDMHSWRIRAPHPQMAYAITWPESGAGSKPLQPPG